MTPKVVIKLLMVILLLSGCEVVDDPSKEKPTTEISEQYNFSCILVDVSGSYIESPYIVDRVSEDITHHIKSMKMGDISYVRSINKKSSSHKQKIAEINLSKFKYIIPKIEHKNQLLINELKHDNALAFKKYQEDNKKEIDNIKDINIDKVVKYIDSKVGYKKYSMKTDIVGGIISCQDTINREKKRKNDDFYKYQIIMYSDMIEDVDNKNKENIKYLKLDNIPIVARYVIEPKEKYKSKGYKGISTKEYFDKLEKIWKENIGDHFELERDI